VTHAATPAAVSLPPVWRNRNFRLVWGGTFVNDVGDWLLMVALPVYVFTESGSGSATAALFVVELACAVVLGPLGGSIVDRLDLRRTLIITNVVQAAALLPLLAVTPDRLWPAYLVAALEASLARINNPASLALLPRIVAPEQLLTANAAGATSQSLARLVGAPLGGVAVELGGVRGVVLADALTFLAVAVAMAFVRPPPRASPSHATHEASTASDVDGAGTTRPGVRAAWRVIRRTPPLPALLGLTTLSQLAQGMFLVLFVVFVVDELGGAGSAVGLIRGVMAIGGIAGGVLIARLSNRLDPAVLLALGLLGMGVVSLVTWNMPAVSTALWVYLVLFVAAGPAGAAMSVGILTIAQRATPADVLGRLIGLVEGANAAGTAIGAIGAGVLVDRVDLHLLLDAQASIYVVSALVAAITIVRRPRSEGDRTACPDANPRTDANPRIAEVGQRAREPTTG
jgi:predicted MFS family arabinose efflux permease